MAGVSVDVQIQSEELRRALALASGAPQRALAPIGMAVVKGARRRIRNGQTPDGAPFAPLLPAYAAGKRGPRILRASGRLMGSISSRVGADQVEVGTNLVYARVHQLGATITPKKAGRLVFRLGGRLVKAKRVTIPARPYLGLDPEDERKILDVLELTILRALP